MAWTSPYSITPSAINSWVGEELKTLAAELTLDHIGEEHTFNVTGAVFSHNDTAGTLLAWRGWALHDRKSTLADKLALPDLPTLTPGGGFAQQAPYTQPFNEKDGRLGYYVGAAWSDRNSRNLRVLYYDNRADPKEFSDGEYGWYTQFHSVGGSIQFADGTELLGQALVGDSLMGLRPWTAVEIHFRSAYLLLSRPIGKHRISLRADWFEVEDDDFFAEDDNNEKGWSFMASFITRPAEHHRLAFEILAIASDRPARAAMGFDTDIVETQLQASYQISF